MKVGSSFPSYYYLLLLSLFYRIPFFFIRLITTHHGALDVLRIMLKAKNPRMPFPSFTLALSRQEAGDNESNLNNSIPERNASNVVEPPVDLLMVSL